MSPDRHAELARKAPWPFYGIAAGGLLTLASFHLAGLMRTTLEWSGLAVAFAGVVVFVWLALQMATAL